LAGHVVADYNLSVELKREGFLDIGQCVAAYKGIPFPKGPCARRCPDGVTACDSADDCEEFEQCADGYMDDCGNECAGP
jgi:hypothetical protein